MIWLAKIVRWLISNPLWGILTAVLAVVAGQTLRMRHLEARADKLQRGADKALKKRASVERDHQADLILQNNRVLERDIIRSVEKDRAEREIEADAVLGRGKIASKYRKPNEND